MLSYRFAVTTVALGLLLSGCATAPQVVSLAPSVSVSGQGQVGQNRTVALSVVDERGHTRLLGYRAANNADLNKAILNDEDVSHVVYQAVAKGLRREGFVPSRSSNGGGPQLTVRINTLKYRLKGTQVAPVAHTTVELAAKASDAGHSYSATYKVRDEDPLGLLDSRAKNQQVINKAVGKALTQVFDDKSITKVLSGHSAVQ